MDWVSEGKAFDKLCDSYAIFEVSLHSANPVTHKRFYKLLVNLWYQIVLFGSA